MIGAHATVSVQPAVRPAKQFDMQPLLAPQDMEAAKAAINKASVVGGPRTRNHAHRL